MSSLHHTMPEDVVPIDEARYNEVIANPDPAKVRSHDADGLPVLIDAPAWQPTADELAAHERVWRDTQVSETEWLVARQRDEQDMQLATTLTAEQFTELLTYRQALRDWPQSGLFPDAEQRPVAPPWIAEQVQ
ncbi:MULTISPECIES: phage tail assembly chaperone [unclassified Pseudomonas]|uniref:Phage tail assembly chaperone n=1 Tax=Pseudomonas sp. Hg7Tf TaxID=3236988 RepID=A0AB39HRY8_9PSED|nr:MULTISPECIES: phage tail assembly chaperone [unclassified Pseudomonas]MDH2559480.1 phage tail assembly chaperone [Pseudomonas sp. Hg5Tf]